MTTDLFTRAEQAAADRDWPTAAQTYRTALHLVADAPAKHHYAYGRALEQLGDSPGAERAFAEAVRRRSTAPAWWYVKLAGARGRLQQWEEAAGAYRDAIARRGGCVPPGWYFQLGTAYEHLGRWTEAADAHRRGCLLDPDSTGAELGMLARETREFAGRRGMLRFVGPRLERIREQALAGDEIVEDRSGTINVYWAQGFAAAPPIVQLCHRRLHRHSGLPVRDLDDTTVDGLVRLPVDIQARGIAATHRSDLLRLALLARYGGSWLDATCLVTEDPAGPLQDLRRPSGWFAFTKRRSTLATWLMTATPGHYLTRMLREALYCYWREHERLTHYFTLHYLFEALTVLDPEFGRLWQATPSRPFTAPFALRWSFAEPYDPVRFTAMLSGSFVHKLTYKYLPEQAAPATTLGHLLATL